MKVNSYLVVGIGNTDRGDDAVGRIVARRLEAKPPSDVRVVEHGGEPAGLIDCLQSAEAVYLVDAMVAGEPAGTISRFDVAAMELPRVAFECSTHGLGLTEAIELARALGKLPRQCVVYGIEARGFEIGDPLSPEVAAAAEKVAMLIEGELRHH
jgi:hydrogenase maturation protease